MDHAVPEPIAPLPPRSAHRRLDVVVPAVGSPLWPCENHRVLCERCASEAAPPPTGVVRADACQLDPARGPTGWPDALLGCDLAARWPSEPCGEALGRGYGPQRRSRPSTDSSEVAAGVVLDVDADGQPVGTATQHAPRALDLSTLETEGLAIVRPSLARSRCR